MFKQFLATNDNDFSTFIIRVTLGAVIFPHGAQKLFGWFGGAGFSGTMEFFTTSLGVPAAVAFLVIMAESIGAVGLIIGFLTRFMALSIGIVMIGAIFMVHLQYGFFIDWQGNQEGHGIEFHLLTIGMATALIIKGGGWASTDGLLAEPKGRGRAKYW
ncbi:DoxX family protein [Cytophagaceae bacterium ABcell3]|nr:DoxX family protein [Cytophagaceae bacterium ABcell3]